MVFCSLSSSKYYKRYPMGYKTCEAAQAPAAMPSTVTPAAGQKKPHTSVGKQL